MQEHATNPILLNMMGQGGTSAWELFEELLEEITNKHKETKDKLKDLLKKLDVVVNESLTQEAFIEKMSQDEWFRALGEDEKKAQFIYCLEKTKSKWGSNLGKKNWKKRKKVWFGSTSVS